MAAGEAVSAVNVGDRVRVTRETPTKLSLGEVVTVTRVYRGKLFVNVVRDGDPRSVRLLSGEFEKVQP